MTVACYSDLTGKFAITMFILAFFEFLGHKSVCECPIVICCEITKSLHKTDFSVNFATLLSLHATLLLPALVINLIKALKYRKIFS